MNAHAALREFSERGKTEVAVALQSIFFVAERRVEQTQVPPFAYTPRATLKQQISQKSAEGLRRFFASSGHLGHGPRALKSSA